jgi:probable addiction module antidote protein
MARRAPLHVRATNMATRDYDEFLFEELQDLDEAATYLTACFEDSEEVFLQGLRKVAEAHGGVAALAGKAGLNRESLYRMLSDKGNPRLSSIAAILEGVGLSLHFTPSKTRDAA